MMAAEIIPMAAGGTSAYTWDRYTASVNTYRIRRGPKRVATITLDDTLPFHTAIVDQICTVLARIERDEGE